ncbi:MAG: adenylate/guanylate cyclase domain-containing protein [Gammaproteobacteria bacterium]
MTDNVAKWLEELGLGEYAAAFADNAIDWDVLSDLTEADLEKVGVKLGHRKKLLKAIAALVDEKPRAPVLSAGVPTPQARALDENLAAWERRPGERKPVTMLFADIMGSTTLTEKLDPEETHDLLYGATQRMCEAVENNRGTVCRFMGDGVMAMFGAPVASEHHAVDACEASLNMQHAIRDYASDIEARHGSGLQIRVGLHSGEVVVLIVGEGDKVEYDASGPTVPIAARMEQIAEPGEVYLTTATHSLAAHRIETAALEPVSVKGISEPVSVFALRRVTPPEEVRPDSARTPFVGRRAELNQFRGMLAACLEESHGQTVYVRGDPGIGKTRLVEEFASIAAEKGVSCRRSLVLPFGAGKGQDAIRSLVRSLLGIPLGSGKAERQRAAGTALTDGRLVPDQAVFLNDLLDLPQPTEQRALYDAMDNATRIEGKQALVASLATRVSDNQPILMVVEDVHWADALTLTYLVTLTKTVAECPALLVMTSRMEGDQLDQTWRSSTGGSPFFTIDLGPLRKQDSIALISTFIDPANRLAENCLNRAAGNPLFLEQLLSNAREGASESLPDSIQSLVLARIDRLEPEDKRALQAASVIGQRFDLNPLRHLLGTPEYDCRELVAHNLVRPEGYGYLFAHALIQEGVRGSLLKRQRQKLHRKAAEWFAGSDPILYAEHLGHAGDAGAAEAFLDAARDQGQQYRYERALSLIERGLSFGSAQSIGHQLLCLKGQFLHDLGDIKSSMRSFHEALDNADNNVQRCDAWMGLAAGMRISTDYSAALELLNKAEPIATKHGLTLQLSRLHHMRGNLYFPLGRVDDCREEHGLALEYARESGSVEDEAQALGGLGDAEYARGRMRSSRDYFRQCLEQCHKYGFGRIEVANRAQMGATMMFCGDWRGARDELSVAIEAAQRVGHRRAEMNAHACLSLALIDMGDWKEVEKATERCFDLAKQLGARAWEPMSLAHRASTLVANGRRSDAMDILREAESLQEEVGSAAFTAGDVYGTMLVASEDAEARERVLRQGEKVLEGWCLSHVHLRLYRDLMEASLENADWSTVERAARLLETFTHAEPLAWSDFFIARARALAAFGRGDRNDVTMRELQRLRDDANRAGLMAALPRLDKALSAV